VKQVATCKPQIQLPKHSNIQPNCKLKKKNSSLRNHDLKEKNVKVGQLSNSVPYSINFPTLNYYSKRKALQVEKLLVKHPNDLLQMLS
jgi:hypothetical protein